MARASGRLPAGGLRDGAQGVVTQAGPVTAQAQGGQVASPMICDGAAGPETAEQDPDREVRARGSLIQKHLSASSVWSANCGPKTLEH